MTLRTATAALLFTLLLATPTQQVAAHGRSHSYSSWRIDSEGARVEVRIPLVALAKLPVRPGSEADMPGLHARYVVGNVQLLAGATPCPIAGPPRVRTAAQGWAVYEWGLACPTEGSLTIRSDLLLDVTAAHLHFARVTYADGTVLEHVLSDAHTDWSVMREADPESDSRSQGTSLLGYLWLGIEHILSGWDHLAFVLALVLLAGTLGELATLVTGFTLAHSVTLGLAVLGVVHLQAAAVEALIGFSIALVAAENSWLLAGRDRIIPLGTTGALLGLALLAALGVGLLQPITLVGLALFTFCHFGLLARAERPARLRTAVAFAFGLVHGFGFAGVLAEMELPSNRLVPALFGFNIGVEIGQLSVVALVWPALRLLARVRDTRWLQSIAEIGSAAICGLGLFWFLTRMFGEA